MVFKHFPINTEFDLNMKVTSNNCHWLQIIADISSSRSAKSPWVYIGWDRTFRRSRGQVSPKIFWSWKLGISNVSKARPGVWKISKNNMHWWSSFWGWFRDDMLTYPSSLSFSQRKPLHNVVTNLMSTLCCAGHCQQWNAGLFYWESVLILDISWYR